MKGRRRMRLTARPRCLPYRLIRHRLVVPKYNPARTVTPEGAVGLGGAYMCIYPMDSPGGYQLIGRTLPIWSTFGRVGPFSPAKPWLLNYFDQARGSAVRAVRHAAARSVTRGRLRILPACRMAFVAVAAV